jgi:hypothetical protein
VDNWSRLVAQVEMSVVGDLLTGRGLDEVRSAIFRSIFGSKIDVNSSESG